MQQYLSRGKRKDNNQWTYGSLINDISICRIHVYGTGESREVFLETVGQWTGLKDKRGFDIYDGDVLKAFTPSVPCYEVFHCKSSYRLRYKLKSSDFYDWGPLFRMDEICSEGRLKMYPEIIGNIHDNPELVNPPADSPVLDTMQDPNLTTAPAAQEAQEVAATESAAQDQAMEVESAEEGTTQG